MRALKRLPGDEKAIVFSSWDDMLQLISRALSENSVRHVRCKGGQTISKGLKEFKASSDQRVLLLPFKSGSNGLNVTEATHVFLCEPLLNVGVEQQAIGRVHRLGQTRPTVVHRLVVQVQLA